MPIGKRGYEIPINDELLAALLVQKIKFGGGQGVEKTIR